MKKYNVSNYVRYKEDLKASMPDQNAYSNYPEMNLLLSSCLCRKPSTEVFNHTTSVRCIKY